LSIERAASTKAGKQPGKTLVTTRLLPGDVGRWWALKTSLETLRGERIMVTRRDDRFHFEIAGRIREKCG
jgi:hypothetical protein